MAIFDDSVGLESFMQKANRISQHLSACHTSEALTCLSHPPPVLQYQNPCKWIPPGFLVRNACANWRLDSACTVPLTDHYLGTCPIRPPHPAVSTIQSEPVISMLSVKLVSPFHYSLHPVFSGNFISKDLLTSASPPSSQELRVETIQGEPLGCGHVRSLYERVPVGGPCRRG